MNNKQLFVVIVYLLIFGGFGFVVGSDITKERYNGFKITYDSMEKEYKWQLESCYQQLGDMQDDYDVNNDGVVDAVDYVAIKKYIMEGK